MLYHSMGRLDEAEVMLVEAHEIRRAAFGEMHPLVAAGYVNVGRILHYQHKDREAVEMFEKSLGINRELLDANHPDIGRGLKELGALYLSAGDLDAATEALEEAVAIFHQAYPAGYYEIAEAESYLGAVRMAEGQPAAAEPLLLGALESLLNGEDRNSHITRETLQRLIELYEMTGEQEAVERFQQQLESIQADQQTLS